MIRDNKTFFFAFLIFILPILGLPLWWRFAFIMLFGVVLMLSALDWKHIRSAQIFSSRTQPETPASTPSPSGRVGVGSVPEEVLKKPTRPRKKKLSDDISF